MTQLLLLLLFLAQVGSGTIQGRIVREGTNDPLAGVQITLVRRGGMSLQQAQEFLAITSTTPAENLAPVVQDIIRTAQGVVQGGQTELKAVSDANGLFTLRGVPPGTQEVRAQLEGYFGPAVGGQHSQTRTEPVTVTANQATNVQLALIPAGSISGRVFDDAGQPMANIPVEALRRGYFDGEPVFQSMGRYVTTDDRGQYRLFRLPPGEYVVGMSPQIIEQVGANSIRRGQREALPGRNPMVPTYFPNSADPAGGQAVELRPSAELAGVDIRTRTAVPVKISGRITSALSAGSPVAAPVSLVRRDARIRSEVDFLRSRETMSKADGTFEFSNVLPGSYELIARMDAPPLPGGSPQGPPLAVMALWAFGRTPVEVQAENVENISVVISNPSELKGRLVIDGNPGAANVRLALRAYDSFVADPSLSNVFRQMESYTPPIGQDGSFTIPLIPPGRYQLEIAPPGARPGAPPPAIPAPAISLPALPQGAHIADIRQGGTSVYDNGLVVGSGPVGPVEVRINTSAGSIEGTVVNPDQKAAAAMTVVLVPPENRRQNVRLFRTARTDTDGRFTWNNVPPGSYTLYAWDNFPSGAYMNTEFLARYTGRGTAVNITAGLRTTATVNAIRENPSR
jgi:hypothetical protein